MTTDPPFNRSRLAPLLLLLFSAIAVCVFGVVSTGIALGTVTRSEPLGAEFSTVVEAHRPSSYSSEDRAMPDKTTEEEEAEEEAMEEKAMEEQAEEIAETVTPQQSPANVNDLSEYECVGWRHTGGCSPDGKREPQRDLACNATIPGGASGYCEYRLKSDASQTKRVLGLHCDSLRSRVHLQCDRAHELLTFGDRSVKYTHDRDFAFEKNQQELVRLNAASVNATQATAGFFTRGIVIVVYESALVGVYASIKSLRSKGCTLPVELWYSTNETDADHPLLEDLVANHGAYRREIHDPRADWFYTKLYAVFYSAFDSVLLLDADNFAVTNPTYLFESPEFQSTGAIFWPDFWQPQATIFNIHDQSLVWPVFGLDYVDMFEQESGQVLINRRRHLKALNTLMFYGFEAPHVHEDLRLVWGDKDLFRFAWMKTQSPFHFIAQPPGSAGTLDPDTLLFCGVTMVQHDPQGEIVFMHRNTVKLTEDPSTRWTQWEYIQQLKPGVSTDNYDVVRSMNIVKETPKCWGRPDHYTTHYSVRSIAKFPFKDIESHVLAYAAEAVARLRSSVAAVKN